jgi:hypothetical protein
MYDEQTLCIGANMNDATNDAISYPIEFHQKQKRLLIDSCLQHAAAAFNLPSAVLWIGTSPKVFGYHVHANIQAFPSKHNVKLINSYLFDYSFDGPAYECPYNSVDEMFDLSSIVRALN